MIALLAGREIRTGLITPLLWVLLGAGQLVLAWVFLQVIEGFSGLEADERLVPLTLELTTNLFGLAAVIAMLAAPLIAMRMISGEVRDGSFDLLASSPVRPSQILLGKFLGLAALMTPFCLLPALNLLLLAGATGLDSGLDVGQIAAATLGLWLATLLFCAVGLFGSSLSSHPGTAVLLTFGVLLLLSVIGRADALAPGQTSVFGWLSWNEHLLWFLLGAVRVSDLTYYLMLSGLFLVLAHRRLETRRQR